MIKFTKKQATLEEITKAEAIHKCYLSTQCSNDDPDAWLAKQNAKNKKYKAETCSCGTTFLCFHHFIICKKYRCPMKDDKGSLLDQLIEGES